MWRYLHLYCHFVRFSFSKAMMFRFDYWLRALMDLVYYITSIAFFKVIYLQTPSIAGWREDQAMVCVAAFLFVDALQMTLFANNIWMISSAVNTGELDYYLVRPVSTLFFC